MAFRLRSGLAGRQTWNVVQRVAHPALNHYTQIEPELGIRFYREMERLLRAVCTDPQRFYKFDPPARRYFSAQFPYAVIYLEKPYRVWIVAVMHVKRRPASGKVAWARVRRGR
ncbi:MAG: hypothetical protein JNN07_24535 [Verrucomicrobiales bacterium]|nr:hypothetical protein [Verrucomicrobiales bacterium]